MKGGELYYPAFSAEKIPCQSTHSGTCSQKDAAVEAVQRLIPDLAVWLLDNDHDWSAVRRERMRARGVGTSASLSFTFRSAILRDTFSQVLADRSRMYVDAVNAIEDGVLFCLDTAEVL